MSTISLSPPAFTGPDADACSFHVVLVEPEIPQNTGSIARLCAATHAWLHLVGPLGFALEDRYLKRAGLDYWPSVRLSVYRDWASIEPLLPFDRLHLLTKKAERTIWSVPMARGDVLIFGCESLGLPLGILDRWPARTVRIPTTDEVRSLNLATSVGIVGYELLRRTGFPGERAPLSGRG